MSMTTWDIETSTRTAFKRKASPFAGDNWTVLHGWKKGKEVHKHYFGRGVFPGWLKTVLEGTRLLVGFNIKFDLLHALQDHQNLEMWMDWVAGGGLIWDCQLAEYLLEGMTQANQYLSLDDVAVRYGGNLKVDAVKALWNAGVDTIDIDRELLERYLCGGEDENGQFQQGDLGNTEMIALGQIARARACGQMNSLLLNMGSLLCSIEMERNGMFVNKPLALELAAALKIKVDELKAKLNEYLPTGLPFEFNWGSPKQKSALIFGGTVQYDSREYVHADGTTTLCDVWHEMEALTHGSGLLHSDDLKPIEYAKMDVVCAQPLQMTAALKPHDRGDGWIPLEIAKLADVPVLRIAGGKNAGEVKVKKLKQDNPEKPKARACKAPYTFKGYTEPDKEWEGKDPGFYSTSSEVIESLGNRNVPFLKMLAELTRLAKDLGTYYISEEFDEEGNVVGAKGMLTLVGLDGIIHHSINHVATVTARFSSSDPNLQNIPKGNNSDVKLVFVSRFADGVIIQSDFKSLEVYLQAILTKCDQLIKDLQAGLDMHCVRVSQKEKISYEEALLRCKGDDDKGIAAIPEWDYKRTAAKVFSFQRAYGAGAKKISDSTGVPIEDIEALIIAENERYPEIEQFYTRLTAEIKANRKPWRTMPHPFIPGVMCNIGTSSVRTPDGKLYAYQEQPAPDYIVKNLDPRKRATATFSPTEIKNYVVQGEGGEWAKAAMWLAVRAFYARRNFGHKGLLVNQVHDALYADAAGDVKVEVAALLHACMEGASEFMEYFFKWDCPVPVPSDTNWGPSMMGPTKTKDEAVLAVRRAEAALMKSKASDYRKELRGLYMGGYVPSFETKQGN